MTKAKISNIYAYGFLRLSKASCNNLLKYIIDYYRNIRRSRQNKLNNCLKIKRIWIVLMQIKSVRTLIEFGYGTHS